MDFGLSELQLSIQENLNRFLDEQAPLDRVREFATTDHALAQDIWKGLVELGVVGTLIPEDYGGSGLSAMDAAVIGECLGSHVTPVPYLSTCVVAPRAITMGGSDTQKQAYLAAIAEGNTVFGIALSEACAARSNAGSTCNDGKLTGSANFVSDPDANFWLVADRQSKLHVVASDAPGIEKKIMPHVDRTRPLCALTFTNTPCETLERSGADVLAHVLDVAWTVLAFDTLGAAQSMLDQAVEYAKQREQFNRVIASFQAVKHMCAEMAAELEPARALLWYAGFALDDAPGDAHLHACHAKAHLAEVGTFVARTATVVHGGMGFTDLLGLHYWFKRIGFNRQFLGGPEWLREQAAIAQNLAA
ncbi:MAG: acyl-CoA dehydrogenase [Gammaproteobacteria bacterium]|nr:acyl-CoA dehydrogenase [Gammaproteobacteria bacterium]